MTAPADFATWLADQVGRPDRVGTFARGTAAGTLAPTDITDPVVRDSARAARDEYSALVEGACPACDEQVEAGVEVLSHTGEAYGKVRRWHPACWRSAVESRGTEPDDEQEDDPGPPGADVSVIEEEDTATSSIDQALGADSPNLAQSPGKSQGEGVVWGSLPAMVGRWTQHTPDEAEARPSTLITGGSDDAK